MPNALLMIGTAVHVDRTSSQGLGNGLVRYIEQLEQQAATTTH